MKQQTMKWLEIFVNHIFDKELIFKIYKSYITQEQKKKKDLNSLFSKENILWLAGT